MRPNRPCAKAGCGSYAQPGDSMCAAHAKERDAMRKRFADGKRDQSAAMLYRTAAWRELRAFHLAQQPLCQECLRQGRITPAAVVDHITPHRGDRGLFFASENLQSLCKRCHDRKTAGEDGGFGNPKR